jgi:hypothetical protein
MKATHEYRITYTLSAPLLGSSMSRLVTTTFIGTAEEAGARVRELERLGAFIGIEHIEGTT